MNELKVYVMVNFAILLLQIAAMWMFTGGLVRLRDRLGVAAGRTVLTPDAVRLLGLGLLMMSAGHELSLGKIRPDGLLQALLLAAFSMMLYALATESLIYPAAMGLCFGLAYLTKSFAFLMALLWIRKQTIGRVVLEGALACVVFAAVAGPYMLALSHQKGRFDFGDSGALNYAWFASGTQKLHLEPNQTDRFGNATVKLVHPVPELLDSPPIFSYKQQHFGTYPDWFDPTYFNERIVPHLNLKVLVRRDSRNVVLVFRYLINHPEGWILLLVLLSCGANLGFNGEHTRGFRFATMLPGVLMLLIYGLVNIEERYVTVAYLVVLLPVFAVLAVRHGAGVASEDQHKGDDMLSLQRMQGVAAALVALMAFAVLSDGLRTTLEERRSRANLNAHGDAIFTAATQLQHLGVKPGDEIACMGTIACVNDNYWARLAGARILTEVFNTLQDLPNRQQVYDVVKAQGAKVLVAAFDPGSMNGDVAKPWVRLGQTNYYALPLNLPEPMPQPAAHLPWSAGNTQP
jgi:hypothetical protein